MSVHLTVEMDMDEDTQILQKIFKRAGIPKQFSKEYAKKFSCNSITVDELLDDSDILNGDAGKDIALGDKIKMKRLLETGRNWMDLFKRIGIVDTVCTEYASTFLVEGMTRDMLRDVTDENLKELEVDAMGDRMKILKAAKLYLLRVPCTGTIKHKDVMRFINENANMWDSTNDNDRKLLQEAASLTEKKHIRNGVLEVKGESIHVFFEVGGQRTSYRVYLENGVPKSECTNDNGGKSTLTEKTSYGLSPVFGALGGTPMGGLAGAALGFLVAGPVGAACIGIASACCGSLVGTITGAAVGPKTISYQ